MFEICGRIFHWVVSNLNNNNNVRLHVTISGRMFEAQTRTRMSYSTTADEIYVDSLRILALIEFNLNSETYAKYLSSAKGMNNHSDLLHGEY